MTLVSGKSRDYALIGRITNVYYVKFDPEEIAVVADGYEGMQN